MFLDETREALVAEAGTTKRRVIANLAAERWKKLPDVEQFAFEGKATEAKAAYKADLEKFVAAGGVAFKRKRENETEETKARTAEVADGEHDPAENEKTAKKTAKAEKKAKKKVKAEKKAEKQSLGRPKKAPSGYFIYMASVREAITAEVGSLGRGGVAKAAGERWAKMSELERAPYERQAAAKKIECEEALAVWTAAQRRSPA